MQELESERRKRVCAGVSFVIFVGLFCRVCWSLLSCMWVSFVVYVGLFCDWSTSRVWMQKLESVSCRRACADVSFVIFVGLFCRVCWSLLSCMWVSFVTGKPQECGCRSRKVWAAEEWMVASRVRGTLLKLSPAEVKVCSKRPTYIAKETLTNDKRDLHMSHKRPICMNEWL